jgi:hypothetical protein
LQSRKKNQSLSYWKSKLVIIRAKLIRVNVQVHIFGRTRDL